MTKAILDIELDPALLYPTLVQFLSLFNFINSSSK